MALDKKNLMIRTLSGLVYAGLLVGVIILGDWATAILSAFLAVIALFEIENNTIRRFNPQNWIATFAVDAAALVCLIFAVAGHISVILVLIWVLLIFIRFIMQIFIRQRNPLRAISIFAFSQLYLGVPFVLLVFATYLLNPWIIICAIAMIWINDTGAYLTGSLIGRNKMFPSLSPKKSWEGFLGGVFFNIGFAFICFYCFHLNHPLLLSNVQGWIFIGICASVAATLGDLFESMLKRSLGIKDFGYIIPGHGGVLDRIDSLMCVIPALYVAVFVALMMFGL